MPLLQGVQAHTTRTNIVSVAKAGLKQRCGLAFLVALLALTVSLAVRIALLVKSAGEVSWNGSLLGAFALGEFFDLGSAAWYCIPLMLILAALPRRFFSSAWARLGVHLFVFVISYALLFGAVAEWVFWDEFGVRFNFIAVDYLVYTTEVIGNIRESYPMPLILSGIAVGAAAMYLAVRNLGWLSLWLDNADEPAGRRWRTAALACLFCLTLGLALSEGAIPNFSNNYNRELARNGLWSLFAAFRANEIDYDRFYPTLPTEAAFHRVRGITAGDHSSFLGGAEDNLLRLVSNHGPEKHLNVIQITVESLSASFMARYGSRDNVTPNLDALVPHALVFDAFYATGNRTDRGMEALTLSVPPTPGRSLIKRPGNENLFTLGSVFRSRGYSTQFIYGGFGYFDNMNHFFGGNGYEIIDRNAVPGSEVTFANVWGACDEDLFRWAMASADRSDQEHKPFFQFVMTTSNHRPYTYPAGRIDLPSKISGRLGAVKYTDYAIAKLLHDCESKPWYKNTVFIIVADHCASSAGKSELPLQNYHIPLLIYAPGGQIKPGVVKTITSQIDVAPTLLALLGWTYPSRFYGWNVIDQPDGFSGRALLGNYQKLGYFKDGTLTVLKPVRQSLAFKYDEMRQSGTPQPTDPSLVDDAIAYYQSASWLFAHGGQGAIQSSESMQHVANRN